MQISQAKNLTINGNGALLQMRRDDYAQPPRGTCPTCSNYSKAEWRCGIWLQQSDGVTLRGLNVIESGGDGVSVESVVTTACHTAVLHFEPPAMVRHACCCGLLAQPQVVTMCRS